MGTAKAKYRDFIIDYTFYLEEQEVKITCDKYEPRAGVRDLVRRHYRDIHLSERIPMKPDAPYDVAPIMARAREMVDEWHVRAGYD